MIRVVTLDHQPLMRLGLEAALRAERDLVPLGSAAGRHELWPLLYRADPDVVLLGQPRADAAGAEGALGLCLRIKRRALAPRVVLYAAPDPVFVVGATLAGADGIADRSRPMPELLRTLREAARGSGALPAVHPRVQATAAARLDPRDHPIFAMKLARTPPAEIAATLRLPPDEVSERIAAMVTRLAGGERQAPVERRRARLALRPGFA